MMPLSHTINHHDNCLFFKQPAIWGLGGTLLGVIIGLAVSPKYLYIPMLTGALGGLIYGIKKCIRENELEEQINTNYQNLPSMRP